MVNPIKKLLAAKIVWRLSGISYTTAVIATNRGYLSKECYLLAGNIEMFKFFHFFDKEKTVLEFGCGPGKNLFGIANIIKTGYGIDVNPNYIKLANKLAERYNLENLHFLSYDSTNFPADIPTFDVIFEKGVFERLEKVLVESYIRKLTKRLNPTGIMILYFLMDRAKGTAFTRRLGDSSYIFWNQNEIEKMLKEIKLNVKEIIHDQFADFYVCELE